MSSNQKTALITGVTGQDGSYLAEFLLKKGYEVHGIKRRASLIKTDRIDHIYQDPHNEDVNFFLHYGDMTDTSNLVRLVQEIEPDEVYNLAAQSHVQVSFDTPEYTTDVDAVGVLRLLEAIRLLDMEKEVKFYQASTSELYGKVQEVPQDEDTPFYPRSPYAAAKLYGYWITVNYREAYGIHASNGILFNHECVAADAPVIIRDKRTERISIRRLKDIRSCRTDQGSSKTYKIEDYEIWDGKKFTDLEYITARRRGGMERKVENDDYSAKTVNTRHGIVETTNHHNMLDSEENEIENRDVNDGDSLLHGQFPGSEDLVSITEDEAKLLGLIVGDGSIKENGKGSISNINEDIQEDVEKLWRRVVLGRSKVKNYGYGHGYGDSTSISLQKAGSETGRNYLKMIRREVYTKDGYKKVPDRILNADQEVQLAFLDGYNLADGLKSNPCTYKFKNFKTKSSILAQGLLFLIKQTTNQDYNITFEKDDDQYGYYSINLLSPNRNNQEKEMKVKELLETTDYSQRKIHRETGISRGFIRKIANGGSASKKHHLAKPKNEVKKSFYHQDQPKWVYDIQTSSGKFMAGVGSVVVSNSPRRGETFVTKKITRAVANIENDNQDKIYLGNLDSKRDWGHAKDFVRGMWMMLQEDEPDDYVLATNEVHTVREFCEVAFSCVGRKLCWEGSGVEERGYDQKTGECLVEVDPQYFRPTEVELLKGDPSKAMDKLGWENEYSFEELVQNMVGEDLKTVSTNGSNF